MEEAKQCWVRRQADKANGGYTITKAINAMLPDPKWPTMTLSEIIGRAFDKFYIDDIKPSCIAAFAGGNDVMKVEISSESSEQVQNTIHC